MVIDHAERSAWPACTSSRSRRPRRGKELRILMTGSNVTEQAAARLNGNGRKQTDLPWPELDLQQRRPRRVLRPRQTGSPEFRVATCLRDRATLELAKARTERFAARPDPAVPPARSPPSGPPQTTMAAPLRPSSR